MEMSIQGIGNAGDINIKAETITIGQQGDFNIAPAGIGSKVFNRSSDLVADINPDVDQIKAGDITINTGSLSITDGGEVNAGISSNSVGNGGNISINARESISIEGTGVVFNNEEIGSEISSDIFSGGLGNSGNLNINTPNLSISNSAYISSDIGGTGNSGNININTEQLSIADNAFISAGIFTGGEGKAGSLKVRATDSLELSNNSTITANIGENAGGTGGNLTVETENLTLTGGSQIGASTSGEGNAGATTIRATDTIKLTGFKKGFGRSGLFANATIGSGNGGDLSIFAEQLILRDGATVQASNFQSLGLSKPGLGNSGDINIDADFVIAFPNQNNDIVANARQGDGGDIRINAEAILGLEERTSQPENITNDIDASSQFGLGGSISINTPDNNPIRENIQLSQNVVTSTVETTDTCSVSETGEVSGLVVKGKGGVTPEPTEPISAEVLIVDEKTTSNLSPNNSSQLNPEEIPPHIQPVAYKNNGEPIYLARGVIVQEDGTLILTAYETENTQPRSASKSHGCN